MPKPKNRTIFDSSSPAAVWIKYGSIWSTELYKSISGGFHKWGYPQIIHFNRVFPYKPSIWGSPICGNSHLLINPTTDSPGRPGRRRSPCHSSFSQHSLHGLHAAWKMLPTGWLIPEFPTKKCECSFCQEKIHREIDNPLFGIPSHTLLPHADLVLMCVFLRDLQCCFVLSFVLFCSFPLLPGEGP